MQALLENLLFRMAYYLLSPLIGLLPGALVGIVDINLDTLMISVDLKAAISAGVFAAGSSGAVLKYFGKK